MAFRKSAPSLPVRGNSARNGGYRLSVVGLLVISVVAPLFILATRTTSFLSPGLGSDDSSVSARIEDSRRRSALEGIEALFPREVLDIVNSNSEATGVLNLNTVGHNEASSSRLEEEGRFVSRKSKSYQDSKASAEDEEKGKLGNEESEVANTEIGLIKQVVQSQDDVSAKSETSGTEVVSSSSTWKRDSDADNSDALVRLMRDQLIMARAYANIAQGQGHYDLVRDLKLRIKEHTNDRDLKLQMKEHTNVRDLKLRIKEHTNVRDLRLRMKEHTNVRDLKLRIKEHTELKECKIS